MVYHANSLLNVDPQADPVEQDHQDVQGLLQNGQPRGHEQAVLGLEKGGQFLHCPPKPLYTHILPGHHRRVVADDRIHHHIEYAV